MIRFCHLCKCDTPWQLKVGAKLPAGWSLYVCTNCCKMGAAIPLAPSYDRQPTHADIENAVDLWDYMEEIEVGLN